MWNRKNIYNKRFKITIISIALSAAFGIVGICLKLEHIGAIALGGVEAIAISFIAGDSYRTTVHKENDSELEN